MTGSCFCFVANHMQNYTVSTRRSDCILKLPVVNLGVGEQSLWETLVLMLVSISMTALVSNKHSDVWHVHFVIYADCGSISVAWRPRCGRHPTVCWSPECNHSSIPWELSSACQAAWEVSISLASHVADCQCLSSDCVAHAQVTPRWVTVRG